jgi:hypothetical protein
MRGGRREEDGRPEENVNLYVGTPMDTCMGRLRSTLRLEVPRYVQNGSALTAFVRHTFGYMISSPLREKHNENHH